MHDYACGDQFKELRKIVTVANRPELIEPSQSVASFVYSVRTFFFVQFGV